MLSHVFLTNFRNYNYAGVEFASGMNCIVGNNGQGKSNLLEAVYYLSLLRSFRTNDVNDMRQVGKDSFIVRGIIANNGEPDTTLSVMYGAERKLMMNNMIVYRASDFINRFICVTFIPQDLSLVQGTPLQRRRFLDIAISQLIPDYMKHLQAYNQALKSRNVMLKDQAKYPKSTVTAYDALLAREGAHIECERRNYIKLLNERLQEYSGRLLHDERVISLKYLIRQGYLLQDVNKTEDDFMQEFLQLLDKNYEHDVKNGSTSIGPHRSDFRFLMDNVMMENYSSQGECRMASLALKLASLDVIKRFLDVSNVTLLIDDVIGELDNDRRKLFFNATENIGQTLLACTNVMSEYFHVDKLFSVSGGNIKVQE